MSVKIHQFNPVIYPRKLWVVKGGNSDLIKRHFTDAYDSEIKIDEIGDGFDGMAMKVRSKAEGTYGSLVWIISNANIGIISHEASHAAMDILSDIGFKLDDKNQEPLAYMIGWITDCIWQVKTGKFKD